MANILFGFIISALYGYLHVESAPHIQVSLHSDLITMIGQDGGADEICSQSSNISDSDMATKPLLLSQYTFQTMSPTCNQFNIAQNDVNTFNWSCFATGSGPSRDINWFFVDCIRLSMVSVRCLERRLVDQIITAVCKKDAAICESFTTSGDDMHVCSRRFEVRKMSIQHGEKIPDQPRFPSQQDIIACACALFILVAFVVSVCVPAEKCKPSYSYDDDVGLRVPLEIYEMYGQHYKPSARRKVKEAFAKTNGSLSQEFPCSHHLQNVAVVANSELGLNSSAICGNETPSQLDALNQSSHVDACHVTGVTVDGILRLECELYGGNGPKQHDANSKLKTQNG